MYSPDELKAYTPEEAKAEFTLLATLWFETDRFKTKLAEACGLTITGVNEWFREGKRPPVWAFLLLLSWVETRRLQDAFKSLNHVLTVAASLSEK
jgi:hypothetical protein